MYTLATGTARTWTGNGTIGTGGYDTRYDDTRSLSWTADGRTLAFNWLGAASGQQGLGVRLLDLAAGGSNLLADSRPVMPAAVPTVTTAGPTVTPSAAYSSSLSITLPTCQQDLIITPDGSAVVCGAVGNTKAADTGLTQDAVTEFREYSTATGKITRILRQWRFARVEPLAEVLWSRGNTFTPLPTQVAAFVNALPGTW